MKVYLIKASETSGFKEYKKQMSAPPQNIFSAAAATPEGVEIEMTDETMDMKVNYRTTADVVAIFMSTPDALRAYDIAKTFRKKGKTVVLGGLHTSFMQEEAMQHADAIMVGECEGIWEDLLNDFTKGELKQKYQRQTPVDLSTLKPYPTHIIKPKVYDYIWSVVVSRGCNNACSYCTVHPFFKSMRFRPVDDIVDEIRNCGSQWVELHSDNITYDRDYAIELFTKLKPLNIKWMGETTINLAEDEELLKLAAESGLSFLLVGLETPSRGALDKSGKGFVDVDRVKHYITTFHKYDIVVDSAFLFGFDEHDANIFEETYEFAKEIDIDSTHSVVVIPFPGTQNFRKLKEEGRILTEDWSKYDGTHVVFQPKNMSYDELNNGTYWFYKKIEKLNKERGSRYYKVYNS